AVDQAAAGGRVAGTRGRRTVAGGADRVLPTDDRPAGAAGVVLVEVEVAVDLDVTVDVHRVVDVLRVVGDVEDLLVGVVDLGDLADVPHDLLRSRVRRRQRHLVLGRHARVATGVGVGPVQVDLGEVLLGVAGIPGHLADGCDVGLVGAPTHQISEEVR